jgi:hypothetical protein
MERERTRLPRGVSEGFVDETGAVELSRAAVGTSVGLSFYWDGNNWKGAVLLVFSLCDRRWHYVPFFVFLCSLEFKECYWDGFYSDRWARSGG